MDRILDHYRRLTAHDTRHILGHLFSVTSPIIAYCIARVIVVYRISRHPKGPGLLPAPRKAIESSGSEEDLPYPPNALPGARDVASPYGSTRVYEWGPVSGRKVLFIHGISTPCIAFAALAQQLVDRGCRVMLFDLFGRGYSDTPDPRRYRQDMGLWTAQIMTVLTSSELSWTGAGERFTLVGYSMGGGIGASFTSYFPHLVESLVLIAPGGLLRHSRIATSSRVIYSGLLPSSLVNGLVSRRLRGSQPYTPPSQRKAKTVSDAAGAEVPRHPALARDSEASISPDRPSISIADAVAWQLDAHRGFLPAFISSIKHAPVSDEHERWSVVGERCRVRRNSAQNLPGLDENKVLVLLGKDDSVIVADEVEEDATQALGEDNVHVVRLEGGHDVPVVNAKGCCEEIARFWGDSPV